jgi:hypothetical protein
MESVQIRNAFEKKNGSFRDEKFEMTLCDFIKQLITFFKVIFLLTAIYLFIFVLNNAF